LNVDDEIGSCTLKKILGRQSLFLDTQNQEVDSGVFNGGGNKASQDKTTVNHRLKEM
jgi:hypothetical protein